MDRPSIRGALDRRERIQKRCRNTNCFSLCVDFVVLLIRFDQIQLASDLEVELMSCSLQLQASRDLHIEDLICFTALTFGSCKLLI